MSEGVRPEPATEPRSVFVGVSRDDLLRQAAADADLGYARGYEPAEHLWSVRDGRTVLTVTYRKVWAPGYWEFPKGDATRRARLILVIGLPLVIGLLVAAFFVLVIATGGNAAGPVPT